MNDTNGYFLYSFPMDGCHHQKGGECKYKCYTLILSGNYHSWIFWFSLAELSCSTPVTMQDKRSFDVSVKNTENTQKGGKRVILSLLLNPGSPKLAFSSHGLPNSLGVKYPAHQGELSSPRRARLLQVKATTRLGELPWSLMLFGNLQFHYIIVYRPKKQQIIEQILMKLMYLL